MCVTDTHTHAHTQFPSLLENKDGYPQPQAGKRVPYSLSQTFGHNTSSTVEPSATFFTLHCMHLFTL